MNAKQKAMPKAAPKSKAPAKPKGKIEIKSSGPVTTIEEDFIDFDAPVGKKLAPAKEPKAPVGKKLAPAKEPKAPVARPMRAEKPVRSIAEPLTAAEQGLAGWMDQVAEDAGSKEVGETELKRAKKLGELLLEKREKVEKLEEELKEAKEAMIKIERGDLPLLLEELGLPMFKLEDGSLFELKEEVQCGITEARRAAAHGWLVDHGFGGLIKTEVVVPFERGAHKKAVALFDKLHPKHQEALIREVVHSATLKSFVKEQLAEGKPGFPLELFGVFSTNVVKVSMPKKKKGE